MFSVKYTVVYVEILAVCFIFVLVILSKVTRDMGTKMEVRAFKWMLRVFLVMEALDALAQMHYAKIIRPPLFLMSLDYSLYMFLIGVLSLLWLVFAETQIDITVSQQRQLWLFCIVMAAIFAFFCFGTMKTGWMFYFDEDEIFQRGPFFVIQNAFSYVSILITTIHALAIARKTTSPVRKHRMFVLAAFIIAPLTGSLLQWLIGGYPFVGPCICVGIMFIFVSLQSDLINLDALTGLNNRKSLDKYIEEIRPIATEHNPYHFYIIDADRFKEVNDRYGHIEGDRALRRIADALRMTGDTYHGFIARYGGDEYAAVVADVYLDDPADFINAMQENLKTVCEKSGIAYPLSVSIGHARLASVEKSAGRLIADADRVLYEEKRGKNRT